MFEGLTTTQQPTSYSTTKVVSYDAACDRNADGLRACAAALPSASQTLANNNFEKWAEPAAGVVVDSTEYGGYWYYTYVYPMSIYPVSEPTIISVGNYEMTRVYAYPNPCTGTLYIVNENAERIELYDMNGKLLEVVNSGDTQTTLNMHSYASGLYLLKVGNNVQKILKK